jgi:hypothetical protein
MTFEFKATVLPNGQIAVPPEIAGQIPAGKDLHVTVAWETSVEGDAFRLGQKLQEKSYAAVAAEDSVYDSLA